MSFNSSLFIVTRQFILVLLCWQANSLFAATSGELIINHELAGLTTSAGYNYPDENAGKKVYPETDKYYTFSSIARTDDNSWILINSPEKKITAWIPYYQVLFMINDSKLNNLPIYRNLAKIGKIDPPKSDRAYSAWGTVEGQLDAFAFPGRKGEPICSLPIGTEVRGVAELPDGIDVLVQTDACKKKYVWLWKMEVNWSDTEWYNINLPIIKPKLSKKPTLPEIKRQQKKTKATLPKKANGEPHTIFIQDTNNGLHDWQQHIPKEWKTKNAAQADILVTIRTIPKYLNSCNYIPLGAFTRIRIDYIVTLTLQDPTKLIAEITFNGQVPEECPTELSVSLSGQQSFLAVGKSPDFDRFEKWFTSLVSGSQ